MRIRPKRIAAFLAQLSSHDVAAGDWDAWISLPWRLASHVAAIDRIAGTLTVGYPCRSAKRPASRTAPCRLMAAARLPTATLHRLQALERSYRRRYVLVAYRLAPSPAISRR